MLHTFALIDLDTQADAVVAYTRGWTKREFLDWLRYQVDLRISLLYDEDMYIFSSRVGLHTRFRITKDGEFVIFADHSARMVTSTYHV